MVRAYAEHKAAGETRATLPVPKGFAPSRAALVAWVQPSDGGASLQAVRLPLAGCGGD